MSPLDNDLANKLAPELQEAIQRLHRALQDPTIMLMLRLENSKRHPGPDAPSVAELAADAFGPHWLAPGFHTNLASAIKNAPSVLALNHMMVDVLEGEGLSFMSLPRPFAGKKLALDHDHQHELARVFNELSAEH